MDAGLGCICDEAVHQAFCDFVDRRKKAHPEGNLYGGYFSALFAENYQKHPAYQRSGGDWLNRVVPGTAYHLPIFQSGFGDGTYPVYFGYDANGEICQLVIQFINIHVYCKARKRLKKRSLSLRRRVGSLANWLQILHYTIMALAVW